MVFGITAAPLNGFIVRLLGYKAEQLHDCLKAISFQVKAMAGNKTKSGDASVVSL